MPRLSLGLGVQTIPNIGGGAAPSGLPVASTASVVISGNATFNGTAFKKVSGQRVLGVPEFGGGLFVDSGTAYAYGLEFSTGKILIPPQTTLTDTYQTGQLGTPSATWRLVVAGYDGGEDSYNIDSITNNSSTDANYIPTSGWSPSITITAASFSPTDLSSLSIWLKADAGVTASGSNVTAWADQSGNGNNATAYSNPQLVASALNSKPVISFDGTTSYASFPISLSAETSRTIFIVGKYNNLSRGQEGLIALGFGESFDLGYVFREAETGNTYYYTPGQIAAPTLTSVANYHIATINHISGGSSAMGINGTFGNTGEISLSQINQGLIAKRNNDGEYGSVNIAEIIIYNRELNSTEQGQVQSYLNTKYAIY